MSWIRWSPSHASQPMKPQSRIAEGQLGHRLVAADRRHGALVVVVERQAGQAVEPADDLAGRVPAALDGGLRHLGQRLPVVVGRGGDVADGEHLGPAGHRQVGPHHQPPSPRPLEAASRRRRVRPSRPPPTPRSAPAGSGRRRGAPPRRSGGRRRCRARRSTPRRVSVRSARPEDRWENVPSSRSAASTSTTSVIADLGPGKSRAMTLSNSSCRAPAISTPVGPPPQMTTDELALGRARRGRRRPARTGRGCSGAGAPRRRPTSAGRRARAPRARRSRR